MIYGVILLALSLVSTVIFVMAVDRGILERSDVFKEVVLVDLEEGPQFVFPEELRTVDLELNRFVDRLLRVCGEGRYSDFRLMFSRRGNDPILPKHFESMFDALNEIRIKQIRGFYDLPGTEGPVWLVTAEYDLAPHAPRSGQGPHSIRLGIQKEDGRYRIGPIPKEALAQLIALEQSGADPNDFLSDQPAQASSPDPAANEDLLKPTTNRPVHFDS